MKKRKEKLNMEPQEPREIRRSTSSVPEAQAEFAAQLEEMIRAEMDKRSDTERTTRTFKPVSAGGGPDPLTADTRPFQPVGDGSAVGREQGPEPGGRGKLSRDSLPDPIGKRYRDPGPGAAEEEISVPRRDEPSSERRETSAVIPPETEEESGTAKRSRRSWNPFRRGGRYAERTEAPAEEPPVQPEPDPAEAEAGWSDEELLAAADAILARPIFSSVDQKTPPAPAGEGAPVPPVSADLPQNEKHIPAESAQAEPVLEEKPAPAEPAAEEKTTPAEPAAEENTTPAEPAAEEKTTPAEPAAEEKPAPAEPAAEEKLAPAEPVLEEKPAPAEPAAEEKPAPAEPVSEEKPAAPAEPITAEKPAPAEPPAPPAAPLNEAPAASETEAEPLPVPAAPNQFSQRRKARGEMSVAELFAYFGREPGSRTEERTEAVGLSPDDPGSRPAPQEPPVPPPAVRDGRPADAGPAEDAPVPQSAEAAPVVIQSHSVGRTAQPDRMAAWDDLPSLEDLFSRGPEPRSETSAEQSADRPEETENAPARAPDPAPDGQTEQAGEQKDLEPGRAAGSDEKTPAPVPPEPEKPAVPAAIQSAVPAAIQSAAAGLRRLGAFSRRMTDRLKVLFQPAEAFDDEQPDEPGAENAPDEQPAAPAADLAPDLPAGESAKTGPDVSKTAGPAPHPDADAPAAETAAPAVQTDEPAPVAETAAPAVQTDEPAPVAETAAPAVQTDEAAPAAETAAPAVRTDEPAPAVETAAPVPSPDEASPADDTASAAPKASSGDRDSFLALIAEMNARLDELPAQELRPGTPPTDVPADLQVPLMRDADYEQIPMPAFPAFSAGTPGSASEPPMKETAAPAPAAPAEKPAEKPAQPSRSQQRRWIRKKDRFAPIGFTVEDLLAAAVPIEEAEPPKSTGRSGEKRRAYLERDPLFSQPEIPDEISTVPENPEGLTPPDPASRPHRDPASATADGGRPAGDGSPAPYPDPAASTGDAAPDRPAAPSGSGMPELIPGEPVPSAGTVVSASVRRRQAEQEAAEAETPAAPAPAAPESGDLDFDLPLAMDPDRDKRKTAEAQPPRKKKPRPQPEPRVQQPPEPEPIEELPAEDPEDAEERYTAELRRARIRLILTAFLTAVSLFLTLYLGMKWSFLPEIFSGGTTAYLLLMLLVLLLASNYQEIGDAIRSLGKWRFTPMLLILAASAFTAIDTVEAAQAVRAPFTVIIGGLLLVNLWGRTDRLTALITTVRVLRDEPLSAGVSEVQDITKGSRGLTRTEPDPGQFMRKLETEDLVDKTMAVYTPIALIGGMIITLLITVGLHMDLFWTGSLVFIGCVPVTGLLAFPRLFRLVSQRLSGSRAALCGWYGAEVFGGEHAILIGDDDIFPNGSLSLNGFKVYNGTMERIIAYAAAATRRSGSALAPVFDDLLDVHNGRHYSVDSFRFYDSGGIGAVIQDDVILLGSLDFMRRMGVHMDAGTKVRQAVYVSVNGELAAVFAVRYSAPDNIRRGLASIAGNRHFKGILVTRTFLGTPSFLKAKFGVPNGAFEYPTTKERLRLSEEELRNSGAQGAILSEDSFTGFAQAAAGGRVMRSASVLSSIVAFLGGILGTLLLGVLAALPAYETATALNVLLYTAAWLAPTLLLTAWGRRF